MSTRAIIQLAVPARELPASIKSVLGNAGVSEVRASHPELPGVYVAVLPDDSDPRTLLQELKRLAEVRHVELEQFRNSF